MCYHLKMKDWFFEWKRKFQEFFLDYGKVLFVLFSFLICIGLASTIIFLITPQKLRVSFLDVGQGDAILIQTPSGKNMLVDGGASDIVLSQLASEMNYFTHDIDVMVATHPDADHVTGLIPVLEKYNVKSIVISKAKSDTGIFDDLNKKIENENADVHIAESGDVIDFHDGVIAKILYPKNNYVENKNDTNDASVSMEIIYGDETFLLTGDLPSTREGELINNGLQKSARGGSASGGNITVYKAGHHGSKTSSGEQLLTYIRPEYAIVSAGENNKYGHPNIETIERLQKYAKEIISTINRGSISFVTDGRIMEIKTDR